MVFPSSYLFENFNLVGILKEIDFILLTSTSRNQCVGEEDEKPPNSLVLAVGWQRKKLVEYQFLLIRWKTGTALSGS